MRASNGASPPVACQARPRYEKELGCRKSARVYSAKPAKDDVRAGTTVAAHYSLGRMSQHCRNELFRRQVLVGNDIVVDQIWRGVLRCGAAHAYLGTAQRNQFSPNSFTRWICVAEWALVIPERHFYPLIRGTLPL